MMDLKITCSETRTFFSKLTNKRMKRKVMKKKEKKILLAQTMTVNMKIPGIEFLVLNWIRVVVVFH